MVIQSSMTSTECLRFAALDLLPERVASAAEAAQALVDISPCPVLTTLPPGTGRRFSRSRYFHSGHIYLNPREVGASASRLVAGWRGVCILRPRGRACFGFRWNASPPTRPDRCPVPVPRRARRVGVPCPGVRPLAVGAPSYGAPIRQRRLAVCVPLRSPSQQSQRRGSARSGGVGGR